MKRSTTAALLLAASLAGACRDGTAAEGPSWFHASLSGEVSREYTGTGRFSSERDYADGPRHFRIDSDGLDTVARETFFIRWPDARRPAPGTYALVAHTDDYGSPRGVTGVYLWQRGDNVSSPHAGELYVAVEGTVEITRSSADEVEGTVRFSGIQVSKRDATGSRRDDPRHQPDPNAPRIEVAGTFRVTRFDENAVVVRTGA